MNHKQLLLDIIGLTYQFKLDWKLVKHTKDTITRELVPPGKYFLHDSPQHSSDIYVRLNWLGQCTDVYVFQHKDWSMRTCKHVPILEDTHLRRELKNAILWHQQEFFRRKRLSETEAANELVGDLIRADSQKQFAEAVKGLK